MRYSTVIATLALLSTAVPAAATVAPVTYTSTEGGAAQTWPFGNGSATSYFLQTAYSASALGSMAPGMIITGIGFRLNGGAAAPAGDLTYSDFTIRIGSSANALGALSTDFASNYGADTIVARTGALTISAGSFVAGAGVNPFFMLNFATPYLYQGGTLLLTLNSVRSDAGGAVPIDAIAVGGGLTDTAGMSSNSNPLVHFLNAPVVQFQTGAVPEPGSWALMLVGIGTVGALMRGQHRRRRAFA